MAKLTSDVQAFIVQRLACFDSHKAIVEAVAETFGVVIDRRQVEKYNPERAGEKPGSKWDALYRATRQAFIRDTSVIPIAHAAFRLRALDQLFHRAEARGHIPLAAQILEQAAKEVGGMFTNRRVIEPADPVAALAATLGVTPDEIHSALATEGPPEDAGRSIERKRW